MKTGKKCCCFYAAIVSFIVIFLITYITGYTMDSWTLTTWLAAIITVAAAGFCLWCRQKEDEHSLEQ
jgi:Kef-type K+ transport system membrane component KefB